MATIVAGNIRRTATVVVRAHSPECKGKRAKCKCPKSLLLYDGATQEQKRVSAKTRSWEQADRRAQEWCDQFDPDKIRLRQLEAKEEAEQVTIERAVAAYLASAKGLAEGTINHIKALFGDVDQEGNVLRDGRLFSWLGKQVPRPRFVADITPEMLISWRSSWTDYGDLTANVQWGRLKAFFSFCISMNWLQKNPAGKRPPVKDGSRTATFSDAQYEKILAGARGNQLLETFLELLRWSGMALIDGVLFDKKLLDGAGVLAYKRKKTGELAVVKLPDHVVVALRGLPAQPFRIPGISLDSSINKWRRALQDLFKKAGITKVQTEVGERAPHPHQLRDTCAVWYLRHGLDLYAVAKILGHSDPTTTAKHYAPFVEELRRAHIDKMTAVLEAAKPRKAGRVVNIAGGR